MTKPSAAFDYDVVLSLNASSRLRETLPAIEQSLGDRRMLAVTLNHRFYTLHDKNFIKGNIEAHFLDHLHFSMRPSSQRLVAEGSRAEIDRFKDLAEVVFVLQVMARYNIASGIIEGNELRVNTQTSIRVADIEEQIVAFLGELEARFSPRLNVRRQFPWLYSVTALFPRIRDRELTFVRSFSRAVDPGAREYNDLQIGNLEKDLFWVGFDPAFPNVPADKPYPATRWTALKEHSPAGHALYDRAIRYCTRCCLPETMEGITFDEIGICVPCRSSEEKMHIDWAAKRSALDGIIDAHRRSDYYDCMLPMSGGKDSTFQAHLLHNVIDVMPLAVTHGQNWLSLPGRYNLENCLQKFDLDHIVFNMNRAVINRMARASLGAIGDTCWHCHIGAGTFPVQTAMSWEIDLMCWGESLAESDGRSSYTKQTEASLFYNLEVSARVKAARSRGEPKARSTPSAPSLVRISAFSSARPVAALSRSMMSPGVPAGA